VEGVTHPDAKASVILREDLCCVIVRDKFSLVKLSEYPFSEGLLDCVKVYLSEPCEDTVPPVPVSEESVEMRVIVQCLTGSLHGEDSSELTLIHTEHLRERPPSGMKEDGIELSVVLKEDP
jgi:hypothetical protein